MSVIRFGNAKRLAEEWDRELELTRERRNEAREKSAISLKIKEQAQPFLNKSLDSAINSLLKLSTNEENYATFMGNTRIQFAFTRVIGCLQEAFEKSGKYRELNDALSRTLKEADIICDMIHHHEDTIDRYRYGSKRIENFVGAYNLRFNYVRT